MDIFSFVEKSEEYYRVVPRPDSWKPLPVLFLLTSLYKTRTMIVLWDEHELGTLSNIAKQNKKTTSNVFLERGCCELSTGLSRDLNKRDKNRKLQSYLFFLTSSVCSTLKYVFVSYSRLYLSCQCTVAGITVFYVMIIGKSAKGGWGGENRGISPSPCFTFY